MVLKLMISKNFYSIYLKFFHHFPGYCAFTLKMHTHILYHSFVLQVVKLGHKRIPAQWALETNSHVAFSCVFNFAVLLNDHTFL